MLGWMTRRLMTVAMPSVFGWDDAALAGASLLGGIFNNRPKKTTQTTSTTLSPDASSLNDTLLQMIKHRMASSADLNGYKAESLKGINSSFDAANTGLNADLTARGLSTSPAAIGPLSTLARGRASASSSLINSLPLLQRQMQGEDMNSAEQLFALQPRTTTTTGTMPGNMAGGGITDMSSMLAFLYGMHGGNQPGGGSGPMMSGAGTPPAFPWSTYYQPRPSSSLMY